MHLSQKKPLSGRPLLWALTIVYFASYMTRVNLAAIIQEVVTDTGFEKSTLSIVLICLSTAYGLGQIINGRLGDKFKPQNMIFYGSLISAAINLIFPLFSQSVLSMSILWGINGFAQAMMWPPIIRIMVANFEGEEYSYSQIFISWGTSLATIAVYLIAPVIIALSGWKVVLIFCGVVGILGTLWWGVQKGRVLVEPPALPTTDDPDPKKKISFPKFAILPLLFVALAAACKGMLRDGVTAWMPSYLTEVFSFGNEAAILCTVTLAIISGVSFTVVGMIYKRFFKHEISCSTALFVVAAISALILFFLFEAGGAILAVTMMALLTGCMHGLNLMLVSHVPKRFRKYGNVSTVTGTVNACSHVGAAIFTYGIALLSEKIGWRWTVGIWVLIALLGALFCFLASKRWKKMID